MNFQQQQNEDPQINLTPLLDVVFLLLIFFMVTTTFQKEAQLQIQIPEASANPQAEAPERLELIIDAQGKYYLDQQEVINTRPQTLKSAILKAAGEARDVPVVIRADARTPHQAVVTAMDVLGQLGFVNLSIATTRSDEGSE